MEIDYSKLPHNDVLLIDMKSFYASVKCTSRNLDPMTAYLVVVGNTERKGSVVLASSPSLKRDYGIKTGSRLYEIPPAPRIHLVNARMKFYLEVSMKITRLFSTFVPREAISTYSIDESWIVVNGCEKLYGDKWTIAKMIIDAIRDDFGLPACVGIGPNKFLAKAILDMEAKKNWIAECRYEDVPDKLWPQPIEEMWGIGSRMTRNLNRMGIVTIGDLANVDVRILKNRFGVMGEEIYWHAWGVDMSPVFCNPKAAFNNPKSFSKGITLLRDYEGEEIKVCMLDLVEEVAKRARDARLAGRTINLAVGYSIAKGGGGFSRSKSVPSATNISLEIYHVCLELLEENYTGEIVRNIHVSLSKLEKDENIQLDLFEDKTKQRKLGYTVDSIRNRFGPTAILRASSYLEGGIIKKNSGKIGGHDA